MANAIEHTETIEWVNGAGYTPCTKQYRDLLDEKETIVAKYVDDDLTLDEYEPADYQRFCEIDNELGNLQLSGHLGKSERF